MFITNRLRTEYNNELFLFPEQFSHYELQLLQQRAENYIGNTQMRETCYLHRDESKNCFNNKVMHEQGGKIYPRTKDHTGHRKNPLNGEFEGVFFNANVNVRDGLPLSHRSSYGPMRLVMSTDLIRPCDLFFADFYCLRCSGKQHYVQIVAAQPNSKQWRWCRSNLVQLNYDDNPFLCQDAEDDVFYFTPKLIVEVMYAHTVDIPHWQRQQKAHFTNVQFVGDRRYNLDKCPRCQKCEL